MKGNEMNQEKWLDENTGYKGVPVWVTRNQCKRILADHGESFEVFLNEWMKAQGRNKFSFNAKQVFEWLGY